MKIGRVLDDAITALCEAIDPRYASNDWHTLVKAGLSTGLSPHDAEEALYLGAKLTFMFGPGEARRVVMRLQEEAAQALFEEGGVE